MFEFVTVIGEPSAISCNVTSKQVRQQAMRNFLERQTREAITGLTEEVASCNPEEPSLYKGKFKLNTWSHKAREKSSKGRSSKQVGYSVGSNEGKRKSSRSTRNAMKDSEPSRKDIVNLGEYEWSRLGVPPSASRLDPFNSFPIQLSHQSEKLLLHYHHSYSMNSVAINPESNFFSFARTDKAVLHSILYLVALHHDLKCGISESAISIHHGGEAFRTINERLNNRQRPQSDLTIVAVAMLVNKENLSGNYELSKIHMQGLIQMVTARGGIHNLKPIFQRIVTWSDFCYASVWDCHPCLSKLPVENDPDSSNLGQILEMEYLSTTNLFGSSSPAVKILSMIRNLSANLSPTKIQSTNLLAASTMIHNVEYQLLLLNKISNTTVQSTPCRFSFEATPLKLACHLYLWLVIRELPPKSELLYLLVQRLQNSLERQLPGWWSSNNERRMWLLWMLFVGGVAAGPGVERWWFVGELRDVCEALGLRDLEGFKECVARVLWREDWCAEHCMALWDDMKVLEEMEKADLSISGE